MDNLGRTHLEDKFEKSVHDESIVLDTALAKDRNCMFSSRGKTAMYDLRVIVAVVMIHQLDIRTCTAQKIL